MLTPMQLQEMAVFSKRMPLSENWALAEMSEDRRQALQKLLEENLRLQRLVTELRQIASVAVLLKACNPGE